MLTSNFHPMKITEFRNLTSVCRVFSTNTAKARATASHPRTPTSISRSVFRKLSTPFVLFILQDLHRLLPSHSTPKSFNKKISIPIVTVASPSPPASGAVPKRKRLTGEMKYYAVRKGYNPGIYTTWKECLGQVTGFKGATCKC